MMKEKKSILIRTKLYSIHKAKVKVFKVPSIISFDDKSNRSCMIKFSTQRKPPYTVQTLNIHSK